LHGAGATRFGATATEAILDEFAARERGERPIAATTASDGGC
jgi:deoxyribose-phosphate aldolase